MHSWHQTLPATALIGDILKRNIIYEITIINCVVANGDWDRYKTAVTQRFGNGVTAALHQVIDIIIFNYDNFGIIEPKIVPILNNEKLDTYLR